LRRRRNATEYPSEDSPGITEDDARGALSTARDVLDRARRLIDSGKLGTFGVTPA
jgi:hypothetical protein